MRSIASVEGGGAPPVGSTTGAWLTLAAAALLEVVFVVCIKESAGFTRPAAGAVGIACYVAALVLFARTIRHIPMTIAYAVWFGSGTFLVTTADAFLFDQPVTVSMVMGMVSISAGVVVARLGP